MSRSTTNWIFVTPLVLIVLWLIPARLTGGNERVDMLVDLAGVLLAIIGLAIRMVARDWKSAHSKKGLVTTGPYAIIRHPMYVASFLTSIGLCLVLGNWYFLSAFSLVYIILHAIVAKKEQRFLMNEWPEDYKRYKASVPAYLPNPITFAKRLIAREPWVTSKKAAFIRELGTMCGFFAGMLLLDLRETWFTSTAGMRPWNHIYISCGLLAAVIIVWLFYTIKRPDRVYLSN